MESDQVRLTNMHKYTTLVANNIYCPMVLTCQMHTDYMVSAHDIFMFDKYSVVFVRCTDNNQQTLDTDCNSAVV